MDSQYQKLLVWKKAIQLVSDIYNLSKEYPREEIYGLVSQIRRCAVSIPSNIAEGSQRIFKKDFSRFLDIAMESTAELETQLIISKNLDYISSEEMYMKVINSLNEIRKMISGLKRSLNV